MKVAYAFLIALAALAVAGCTEQDVPTAPDPFVGGDDGLVSAFQPMGLDEDGVETVFEEDAFDVVVNLKNKGEHDVPAGKAAVRVLGIDTALFGITNPVKGSAATLEKISEFNTIGGEEDVDFGKAKLQSIIGSFLDATFFAHIDYEYATFVNVPAVCFKYDVNDLTVCDLQGSKEAFSSGAPIRVSSVEEDIAGSKRIALTFRVDNAGGGRSTLLNSEFLSRFDRAGFSLSEQNWECKSAGSSAEARFTGTTATIRCVSPPLNPGDLFTKQVTLRLDYLYRDTIQHTVRVKKNPSR
ncbi:MAG TPA: hypothetical protein VJC16_03115 [Candidatus Nanoarchaeia archaeon]|nr:hypothetical protein [Candidatus Nanoarchaeia archaeon]